MRTYTALQVRQRFGQVLDEAAGGERIVIVRAGQPIAALVPLTDLARLDPAERIAHRLAALSAIRRMAARVRDEHGPVDAAAAVRKGRRARTGAIVRHATDGTP